MNEQKTIHLPLIEANAGALAPFGQIIGSASGVKPVAVDFYKGAVAMSYPVKFECEHPVEVSLANLGRRLGEVRYMERHFQHTQAFIPLGGKPFVAVMAPPNDDELPDLASVKAFLFDGSAGFQLNLGTWHEFPFALEPETEMIVLLSSQTGYDLKSKDAVTEEAFGPDLDKKDIAARTGTLFQFDLKEYIDG
ncbi:ureidoglycolate lyase [uncultured Parasphingorhabdus sp.]|uniref:ureidoglycolate lyase n=1 Tax=uncultured Parasphingorhabdus sp. TaxID=2709694 RepID=UPI0030D84549|tara:strand:+ start:40067 stop:40645 length:579 start_codon:yes stop_codon:yes gene_type:complete